MTQVQSSKKKSYVFHPILLAIFPVISLFSININELFPIDILLPIFVIVGLTLLIWLIPGYIFKNYKKSALIVSLGLILFFSYGHFYSLIDAETPNAFYKIAFENIAISHLYVFIPFISIFFTGSYFLIRTKKNLDNLNTIVNYVAITLVIISMFNIVNYYLENDNTVILVESTEKNEHVVTSDSQSLPNVYYFLLDEYSGNDSLKKYFNYDNIDFLTFLEENGFHISSYEYSNYPKSEHGLASVLNMEYINYLTPEKDVDSKDVKKIFGLIDNNKVMQHFKARDYKIINFDSNWGPTKNIEIADENFCHAGEYVNPELIILILKSSMLNPIYAKVLAGDYRDQKLCVFSKLEKIQEDYENPYFVFAHLQLPHGPYVFGPNGEPVNPKTLELRQNNKEPEAYLNQLKFTNKKMIEIIPKLLDVENPPIIIIQSDHGYRMEIEGVTGDESMLKGFNNINVHNFPQSKQNLELEDFSQVNTFRIFFNLFFNENYEILEDKHYYVDGNSPYEFKDITHIFSKN